MTDAAAKAAVQEALYEHPYHYTPTLEGGRFARSRVLSWAYEYMCYVRHVVSVIDDLAPASVIDVGCGDGRLLNMLGDAPDRRLVGVDLSPRAIAFARAFGTGAFFEVADAAEIDERFDVVTAIEVLEHVPDADESAFCRSLRDLVAPGGSLIVSVPSIVLPVHPKHHRHYTADRLIEAVLPDDGSFETVSLGGVYAEPGWLTWWQRLTCNRFWRIEVPLVETLVWRWAWRHREVPVDRGRHLVVHLRRRVAEP